MTYAKTSLRAEQRALREQMRALGLSHRQIAVEFARRYRLRPRAAWRHAYGWSQTEAAGRISDYAARAGLDPGGATVAMTAPHLSEYENWPAPGARPAGRRPTPYLLSLLASVYECAVPDLLDLADYEHMPPADRLVIDKTAPVAVAHEQDPHDRLRTSQHAEPILPEGLVRKEPAPAASSWIAALPSLPWQPGGPSLEPHARGFAPSRDYGSEAVGDDQEIEDPVRRRTFVGLTSTSLLSTILDVASDKRPLDAEPFVPVLAGHTAGTELEQAGPASDIAALTAAVNRSRRQYQDCRYSELIRHLPQLLVRLHAACLSLDGDAKNQAFVLSADTHHVAAGVLLKLDDQGLAYLAADRSMRAAQASEDPVTVGASARIITHALMNGGHLAAAIATASRHAARLDRDVSSHTPESLSVYGSLLLRGAIAAAQHDQRATAHELLGEADDAARRLGTDGNLRWTAFGPANAKLHRVSIAVTLGDAGTAVDVARGIDLSAITVTERKATLLIDTARAFLQGDGTKRHTSPFAPQRKSRTRKLPDGLRSTGSSANLLPQPRPLSGVTPRISPPGSEYPGDRATRRPLLVCHRLRRRPRHSDRLLHHARARAGLDSPGHRHTRRPGILRPGRHREADRQPGQKPVRQAGHAPVADPTPSWWPRRLTTFTCPPAVPSPRHSWSATASPTRPRARPPGTPAPPQCRPPATGCSPRARQASKRPHRGPAPAAGRHRPLQRRAERAQRPGRPLGPAEP